MRRYWLKKIIKSGDQLVIADEDFHHIFEVCRFQPGEAFELLGITPQEAWTVKVNRLEKKRAYVDLIEKRLIPPLPKPYIHLGLAVPKWPTFDNIVEKMVEMGVYQIQPLFNQFSHIQKVTDFSAARKERLQKIILNATQQTGRGDLMEIASPLGLYDWIRTVFNPGPSVLGLVAYESLEHSGPWKSFMQSLKWDSSKIEHVWILIGSEGGWAKEEIQILQDAGLHPFSLGNQVLRVETACVAAVAGLKYELGLF